MLIDYSEQEWLHDPALCTADAYLQKQFRKMRLMGCGCCRMVWQLIDDDRGRSVVEVAEQFADGLVTEERLLEENRIAYQLTRQIGLQKDMREGALYTAIQTLTEPDDPENHPGDTTVGIIYNHVVPEVDSWLVAPIEEIIRDIFGNPFRPITFNPVWLTSTVKALAQTAYEDRRFDLLPILADALEEAGCDSADILDHCRTFPGHVRGCWVVDQILGKA